MPTTGNTGLLANVAVVTSVDLTERLVERDFYYRGSIRAKRHGD